MTTFSMDFDPKGVFNLSDLGGLTAKEVTIKKSNFVIQPLLAMEAFDVMEKSGRPLSRRLTWTRCWKSRRW